jgi:HK97 family phage prohead protease
MLEQQATFLLDTEIKSASVLPDGTLFLRGFASAFERDRDKDIILPRAFEDAKAAYLKNPILLLNHDIHKPIGRITDIQITQKGVLVEAIVPPAHEPWAVEAYNKIKEGIYRAFSIGGIFKRMKDIVTGMDWAETSVVGVPANASSLFEVVQKSFKLQESGSQTGIFTGDRASRPWSERAPATISQATLDQIKAAITDLQSYTG